MMLATLYSRFALTLIQRKELGDYANNGRKLIEPSPEMTSPGKEKDQPNLTLLVKL